MDELSEEEQLALKVECVRRMLRDAFREVDMDEPYKKRTLSHDEFIEMRADLPLFVPEDLQRFLPLVLEELMDTHTNDDINTENADLVLMFLNVDAYVSEDTYESWSKTFGEHVVENDRKARQFNREFRQNSFSLFTRDQAQAVYHWLLLARHWRDYDDWADDLQGSLEYWKKRAEAE